MIQSATQKLTGLIIIIASTLVVFGQLCSLVKFLTNFTDKNFQFESRYKKSHLRGLLGSSRQLTITPPSLPRARSLRCRWRGCSCVTSISTSLPQIQREIADLWTKRMDDMVDSMSRRLKDVVRNWGHILIYWMLAQYYIF